MSGVDDLVRRFTGFDVPDQIFDPSTAPPALLRQYGLPRRPDATRQPLLRQVWDRGFGKPMLLQPFEIDRERLQRPLFRPLRKLRVALARTAAQFETSDNWSGAYITANRDKRFLQIWGSWEVPDQLKPPAAAANGASGFPYVCSNWIGLDGQRRYFNSSLPQVGTVCTLAADGSITSHGWTQWWARDMQGNAPVPLGLQVDPGDDVLCVLTASDPQTVICVMVNLSADPPVAMAVMGTSPEVTLPDGSKDRPDIAGATAEWIVERPQVVDKPTPFSFPDYGETGFADCIAVEGDDVDSASWFNGLVQQLPGASRIRMFEVLDSPARTAFISMPRELGVDSVRVHYGGF